MLNDLINYKKYARVDVNRESTLRSFDGGLNEIDNELNMSPEYQVVLSNCYRDRSGTLAKRFGTRLFCKVDAAATFVMSESDAFYADFSISTSTTLYIRRNHHGLATGNQVTFSGMSALNGIPAVSLNTTHTVTKVDAHIFYITITAYTATDADLEELMVGSYNFGAASTMTGNILNMWYFAEHIIVATTTGQIAKINGAGVLTRIWDATIATGLSVSPWTSGLTQANAAEFGGELIVVNGVDKPLLISSAIAVNYLQDLGSSSNANTPIAKYVVAMNHYVVMAGNASSPSTLYISHKDASGTWSGDAAPNVGRNDDLSKIAGTSEIRGLGRYRDRLVVTFDNAMIIAKLDIYNSAGTTHTPDYNDTIDQHGAVSHRSIISVGDELLLCDNYGVPSVAQALFTGTLRPERASRLIDRTVRAALNNLDETSLDQRVFSVYNRDQDQYMLFIPNDPNPTNTTETTCYVYTSRPGDKSKTWAKFTGWKWKAACRSQLNRVFFADDTRIYLYGNYLDEFYADRINGPNGADGDDVNFDIEWPWFDFGARGRVKLTSYIQLETSGNSTFTFQLFVDNIRVDEDNADNPALAIDFVGGSSGGYGNGTQPYGGGRRTIEERLWNWPSKFKIAKFRLKGASKLALSLISITIFRKQGNIRR
jgi:hypothetical protein